MKEITVIRYYYQSYQIPWAANTTRKDGEKSRPTAMIVVKSQDGEKMAITGAYRKDKWEKEWKEKIQTKLGEMEVWWIPIDEEEKRDWKNISQVAKYLGCDLSVTARESGSHLPAKETEVLFFTKGLKLPSQLNEKDKIPAYENCIKEFLDEACIILGSYPEARRLQNIQSTYDDHYADGLTHFG